MGNIFASICNRAGPNSNSTTHAQKKTQTFREGEHTSTHEEAPLEHESLFGVCNVSESYTKKWVCLDTRYHYYVVLHFLCIAHSPIVEPALQQGPLNLVTTRQILEISSEFSFKGVNRTDDVLRQCVWHKYLPTT